MTTPTPHDLEQTLTFTDHEGRPLEVPLSELRQRAQDIYVFLARLDEIDAKERSLN